MTERVRSLHDILDELHQTLESAPEIGEDGRTALREAATDIREALDRRSGEPDDADRGEQAESLQAQLASALERFEESHPQLTAIVGRVADALSDIGI